jgi:argininosuccinate lyase
MRKGRFKKPAPGSAQRYGESVSFDWRLYRYDVAGSIMHALFDSDVAKIFDVRTALAKKRAIGAPSAENIAAQIKRWRSDLGT